MSLVGDLSRGMATDKLVRRCVRGPLAQLVEQRTFNPWVVGSIPTGPTFLCPFMPARLVSPAVSHSRQPEYTL